MDEKLTNGGAGRGPESVVADPLAFKAKLNIGAEAYAVLSRAEGMETWLSTAATGAAGAAVAGGVWYSGLSTLGALGVSLGMVATPVGWIAATGVGTAAAGYGIKKLLRGYRKKTVMEIPKFINTPLDVMGAAIVSVLGAAIYRVLNADGVIPTSEKQFFCDYFQSEWGISAPYVEHRFEEFRSGSSDTSPEWIHAQIEEVARSGDVSKEDLVEELLNASKKAMESDDRIDEAELREIEALRIELLGNGTTLGQFAQRARNSFSGARVSVSRWIDGLLSASSPENLEAFEEQRIKRIATIWVLGKTGAGKSTFIRFVSEHAEIPVGPGFRPCTEATTEYLMPSDAPLVRFLDTRGLGEAGYDAGADIDLAASESDLIVVVAKLTEPDQGEVLSALRASGRKHTHSELLVLHSGAGAMGPDDCNRMFALNREQFDSVWNGNSHHVVIDFLGKDHPGHDELITALSNALPSVGAVIEKEVHLSGNDPVWAEVHPAILRHAGLAAGASAIPAAGAFSAAGVQGVLFQRIANAYGVEFDKKALLGFLGSLGIGLAVNQGAAFGAKALLSSVPVAGSAAAGGIGFATTYALGFAAAYYFRRLSLDQKVSGEELRAIYRDALLRGRDAGNRFG